MCHVLVSSKAFAGHMQVMCMMCSMVLVSFNSLCVQ